MADLFRVVRRLLWLTVGLLIAAVWLIPSAQAVETCSGGTCTQPADATAAYWYKCDWVTSGCNVNYHFPTLESAIADCNAKNSGSWCEPSTWSGNTMPLKHNGGSGLYSVVRISTGTTYSCPSGQGWTLDGSTCSRPACTATQSRDPANGVCKESCNGASIDQYAGRKISGGMAYTKGMQFCVNGCRYYADVIGSKAGVVSGAILGSGTGQACDASHIGSGTATTGEPAATEADTDAAKCIKAGQEYGTVSGKTVCTGPMSTKEVNKKVTDNKTNPDTTTPSTTREETTVCKDGKCIVEVKVTNSGGGTESGTSPSDGNCVAGQNGVTTCSKTQDQQSFCADHPTDPQCKDQTTFGGACAPGAQPTCTGDAVQCEQARAAWKIECDLTEEPTDAQYTLGKSLATGGADPVVSPLDPSKLTTVNVTDLVTTAGAARTLTATCIPNQTFSVMSHSYTFDTTLFCQFASIIGYLMVAASSVIAIRMVVTGGSV
jgi:hypothetical protein